MEAHLQLDPEIDAMGKVLLALEPLSQDARQRVWGWIAERYGFAQVTAALSSREAGIDNPRQTANRPEGTINTVAIRIGAESCRDLMIAAAAYITIFQGKVRFTKAELISAAKEAQAWKSDHSAQISINIKRMQETQELFEKSKDIFALSPKKLKELESKIAE